MLDRRIDRFRSRDKRLSKTPPEQLEEISTPSLRTPAVSSPSLVYECLFNTQGSVDSVLAEGLGVDFACQEGLLPVGMETVKHQGLDKKNDSVNRSVKGSDGSGNVSAWEAEQDSANVHSGGGFRPVRAWASAGAKEQKWISQDARYPGRQRRLFDNNRGGWGFCTGEGYITPRQDTQRPELEAFNQFSTKRPTEAQYQGLLAGQVRFAEHKPVRESAGGETEQVEGVVVPMQVQDDLEEERMRLEKETRVRQSWEAHRKVEAEWQQFLRQQAERQSEKVAQLGDGRVRQGDGEKQEENKTQVHATSKARVNMGQWEAEQQRWAEQVRTMEGGRSMEEARRRPQQSLVQKRHEPLMREDMFREQQVRELNHGQAIGEREYARLYDAVLPNAPPFINRPGDGRMEERAVWTDPEEDLFSRDARMRVREKENTNAANLREHAGWGGRVAGYGGIDMQSKFADGERWRGQEAVPVRNTVERVTGWNPTAEAEMYRRRGFTMPPMAWQGTNEGPAWQEGVMTGPVPPRGNVPNYTAPGMFGFETRGVRQVSPTFIHPVGQPRTTAEGWNYDPHNGPGQEAVPVGVWGPRDVGLSKAITGGSPQLWTWTSGSPGAGIASALPVSQIGTGSRWDTKVVPIEWPRQEGGPPPVDRINMKLPVFTGAKQPTLPEDAEQWLNTLGAAVGNNLWTFDQAYKMIQSHLQGAAGTWYGSYGNYFRTHPEGRYAGWHAFWVEFEARFVVRDESQLETALQNRVQRTNESIMDFADSLRVLAAKLGISCDSRRVRMLFLNGLHNQQVRQGIMLHAVVRMTSETLRAIVAMALEYEDYLATEKLSMKHAKQAPKDAGARTDSVKDSKGAKPTHEAQEGEGDSSGWKQAWLKQAKQIDELYKRQTGLSQTLAKTTQQATAPARRPLSEIQCNNCKEMGHFARNCPHPRKEYKAAVKSVHFLEEDLEQIRMTEEVEPGWYPLEEVCTDQFPGTEDAGVDDEGTSWGDVCTLNVGCAPDHGGDALYRCRQMEEAPMTRGGEQRLDPRHTWVRVGAEGKITGRYVAAAGESMRDVGQNIAKLGSRMAPLAGKLPEQVEKRQQTSSKAQPSHWPSAYDPAAPPLPGITYQPCYTAYLPAAILGVGVNCLLDTGATISVLTVATVKKLKLQAAVQKTNKCFYTASAQCVPACGELPQLPIMIDGVSVPVNFYIVQKGGYELLLGMDFLVPRCAVVDMGRATLSFAKQTIQGDDYAVMKKVNLDIRRSKASPLSYLRNCTVVETTEWHSLQHMTEGEEISQNLVDSNHDPGSLSAPEYEEPSARESVLPGEGQVPDEITFSQFLFGTVDTAASPWSVLPGEGQGQEELTYSHIFSTEFQSADNELTVTTVPTLLHPNASSNVENFLVTGRSQSKDDGELYKKNLCHQSCHQIVQAEPRLEESYVPLWLEESAGGRFLKIEPRLEEPTVQPRLEEPEGCKMLETRPTLRELVTMPRLEEHMGSSTIYATCKSQTEDLELPAARVCERVTGRWMGVRGGLIGIGNTKNSESEESEELDIRRARRRMGVRGAGRLKVGDEFRRGGWLEGREGQALGEGLADKGNPEDSESEESEELEIRRGRDEELGVEMAATCRASVMARFTVQESLSHRDESKLSAEKKTVSPWSESPGEDMAALQEGDTMEKVSDGPRNPALDCIIEWEQRDWEEECERRGTVPGSFHFLTRATSLLNTTRGQMRKVKEDGTKLNPQISAAECIMNMAQKEWEVQCEEEGDVPCKFRFPATLRRPADEQILKVEMPTPDLDQSGNGDEMERYVSAVSEGKDRYLDANCFTFGTVQAVKMEVSFPDNIQVGEHLTDEQKRVVRELVMEFAEIFEDDPYQLTCSKMDPHMIETGEARPINIPPYRYSQKECDAIELEVTKMLQLGIIEPSNSPWSASVVAVIKKDLSLRICVDFRELNKVTRSDTYPIPLIEDMLDRLAGSDCFSSLDLRSAFWQVMMSESSKEKTAFSTKTGHYQFRRMPFGLKNALPTFQRGVDKTFRGLQKTCQQYVDDITAHGKGFKEGISSLRGVFLVCRESVLKIKAAKTMLIMEAIDYLGFVVSGEGVKPDPKRVEAILQLKVPTDVTGVRSAIGMYIQYKRYMPEFSKEAAVLNDMVKKGKSWNWTEGCELAWQKLKQLLTSAPLLAHLNLQMTMVVQSDWSPRALGAVLSQRQYSKGGEVIREEVVAYYSKKLNDAERNYSATEGECLAVVRAISNWHKYLFGRKFVVETDHLALRWLMQARNLDGRVARWSVKLMPYEFTIVYRRGSKHLAADAMSRLRQVRVEELITFCVTLESIQEDPLDDGLFALMDDVAVGRNNSRALEMQLPGQWGEDGPSASPVRWIVYQRKLGEWFTGEKVGSNLVACMNSIATAAQFNQATSQAGDKQMHEGTKAKRKGNASPVSSVGSSRSWNSQWAEMTGAAARGRMKLEEMRRPPGLEQHVTEQMQLRERREYEDRMQGLQREGKPTEQRETYLEYARQLQAGRNGSGRAEV